MKRLLFILIIFLCHQLKGQNAKIDSLQKMLPTLSISTEKVDVLNYLSLRLSANDTENARAYALESIQIASEIGYKKGLAKAYNARAVVNRIMGSYDLALEDFIEALQINQSIEDSSGMAQTLNGIGALYMLQEDFQNSLEHFEKGFHLREQMADTAGMAVSLSNMGNASEKLGLLDKALDYHEKSIAFDLERGDEFSTSYSLHSMGLIYQQKGLMIKAEQSLRKALRLRLEANHNYGIAETSLELGKLLYKIGDFLDAKRLLSQSEENSTKLNITSMKLEAMKYQAEIAQKEGNLKFANELFRQYATQKDSVFQQEKQQQFEKLRIRYELDKQERENEILKKDKLLQKELLDKQNIRIWFLITGIAFVSILLIVVYKSYSNKQKVNSILLKLNGELKIQQEEILAQTDRLQEANLEISRINLNLENLVEERTEELQNTNEQLEFYLYHSAHDLRRPITSIRGLTNIAKFTVEDKEALGLFKKIDDTSRNMLKMIQKLNMLTEINRHYPKPTSIPFREMLNQVLGEYEKFRNEKKLNWKIEADEDLAFTSDELLSEVILKNLIENAISFSDKPNANILIAAKIQDGKFHCSIQDQGCGIPEDYLPAIFDLYFRATEKSMGNGIGLYLVKKSIDKLGGEIKVNSQPDIGTQVAFCI